MASLGKPDKVLPRQDYPAYIDPPNTVSIEHSHDFPLLLRLAFHKLPVLSPGPVDEKVNKILDHEYAHTIPAFEDESLVVRYGVQFIETPERIAIRPRIAVIGWMTHEMYQQIACSPENPSHTDRIIP